MRLRKIKLPKWAENSLVGVWLIIASPAIVAVVALVAVFWLKREAIGPSDNWDRWFAWHPVNVGCSFHPDWRWLERVERQSSGIMFDTLYRAAA